jgi:hypothetical protein
MTRETLSPGAFLLILFTSGPAAPAQQSPSRQPCFPSSERTTTSASADSSRVWITDLAGLQQITSQTAPRRIRLSLRDVAVDEVSNEGFWIVADGKQCRLYVVPAEGQRIRVRRGEIVSVQGEIRYGSLRETPSAKPRQQLYLYSYIVRPAWYPDTKADAAARR